MKLSCKVIEDLLPLYHDKVCSPESSLLVAEHLGECEGCKRLLSAMDREIEVPPEPEENQRVLEGISRRWRKTTRKALLHGAALALTTVLVLTGLAGGFWYGTQAAGYQELAARMEVTAEYPHESSKEGEPDPWIFPREYSLFRGGYHFWLRLPGFLDFSGGVIAVYPDEGHQHWQSTGLRPSISLGVKLEDGEPSYVIAIEEQGAHLASFLVDGDMNYIPGEYDEEREFHLSILEEYRPEITEIIQAAKDMWELE